MEGNARGDLRLGLLGGFSVSCDRESVVLPLSTQRLLALLALHRGGVQRAAASEMLWPDRPRRRASANLRSALWGGRRAEVPVDLIQSVGQRLCLPPSIGVDLHDLMRRVEGLPRPAGNRAGQDGETIIAALNQELLMDWSEDWIQFHRDRWDEIRLHTLEDLAQQLLADKQYLAALQAALTAVSIDSVRETPHRIIIEIHLAEGNVARAISCYQRYRILLQRELGIAPSPRMSQLVRGLMATSRMT